MEDENLNNGTPNITLAETCDNLFFSTGNIGFKNLGYIVSADNNTFQNYINELEAFAPNIDEELSQ